MSRNATYKTWGQMNNDPDLKDGQPPGTKSKPKSTITIALKDVNHLKFALKKLFVYICVETIDNQYGSSGLY